VTLDKALAAPLLVWFGMAALVAPIVLIATSVWRQPLRLSYEAWHVALDLTVVHVLERPPEHWAGESGYVRADVLSRHLPPGYRRFQFFICGPDPMMDPAEEALVGLGVPSERVHTERFDMV
jgi:ferredoxin-NADP reductase